MLEFETAFAELESIGLSSWANQFRAELASNNDPPHGHWPDWKAAFGQLPTLVATDVDLKSAAVTFTAKSAGNVSDSDRAVLASALQRLHPWRKGPFNLFGVTVDSEWRSNLKWDRVAPHVDLSGKTVLDVGCGNGYYGWRMLGAGARCVIGLEPHLPYVVQHYAVKRFAPTFPNHVLHAGDRQITELEFFDTVFSMGVLYHCRQPEEHLRYLKKAVCPGGSLILETLIIPDAIDSVLSPQRYAKMRNARYIPSIDRLIDLVKRSGFDAATVVDVTRTTTSEQRRTQWMTYESLDSFLSPDDNSKTVEGYPAPTRAVLLAKRR